MNAPTPIWQSIAHSLKGEIAAGQYRPGDKLPSESDLARRFGVNRHTVRRALSDLSEKGLVRSRRGSGVFVRDVATEYPLGRRVRFQSNINALGHSARRKFLHLETRCASEEETKALDLSPGDEVHVCEGLSYRDDSPIAAFRSVFPAGPLPDLPAQLRQTSSVTKALAACGVSDYMRVSTRLSAEAAGHLQALHLNLPEGAPLLRSVSVNVDMSGKPVEYGTTWFAGDRVVLTVSPDQD